MLKALMIATIVATINQCHGVSKWSFVSIVVPEGSE